MQSLRRDRALLWCTLGVLITAIAGIVLIESGSYYTVREKIAKLFGRKLHRIYTDLRHGETLRHSEESAADILAKRDQQLTLAEQKKLLKTWYDLKSWNNMWFLGIKIQKNPMDLWMMQQIIFQVQPDFIIETGTLAGGSALYWAHLLDALDLENSRVITVDIADHTESVSQQPLWKKYVEFIHSSSTDPETVAKIAERVKGKKVIVTLDSDHSRDHVLQEMRLYGPMVSPDSYMVVEDTVIDAVPVLPRFGPGPMSAVVDFMKTGGDTAFDQDLSREIYLLTFNPGGWLRRRAN